MILGDPDLWSDTFPEDLIPRVLSAAVEAWTAMAKPGPAELEVPITRRFKHVLKQVKDFNHLPFRVERESVEDDPTTGEELGRIDIKLLPAVSAREDVYFAFECKRLNVQDGANRRSLAPEYVTEGMMRFITGQYAASMRHGGMVGYVLDGRADEAIRLVGNNIASRAVELCMTTPASLVQSTRCTFSTARESAHTLSLRVVTLHHLFFPCKDPIAAASASRKSSKPRQGRR